MGGMVEKALQQSVQALTRRDSELARQVEDADRAIDLLEIEIEEDCLKILALHQPVAIDLRFVIAVMKMNAELERIADQAVNIASRALRLAEHPPVAMPPELLKMVTFAQAMLKDAIDSLVSLSDQLARDVITRDEEIDQLHRSMYGFVQEWIRADVENIDSYINLLSVSRNIERVGDQVTNIAEDVVYLVTGEIVRHM